MEERDFALLEFLWKWKMATTMLILKKFFAKTSIHTGYKRLLKLEKAGFINARADHTGRNFLWMLKKKGFQIVRFKLPELREQGFLSENIFHDYLVTTTHLGGFLGGHKNVKLITENELRRYSFDELPSWLPSPKKHRPDGYFALNGDSKIHLFALEVELNIKNKSRYLSPVHFYNAHESNLEGVIWVLDSASKIKRFVQILNESGLKESSLCHFFVTIGDLFNHGWDAELISSVQIEKKSLNKLFGNILGNTGGALTDKDAFKFMANLSKSSKKLETYRQGGGGDFSQLYPERPFF